MSNKNIEINNLKLDLERNNSKKEEKNTSKKISEKEKFLKPDIAPKKKKKSKKKEKKIKLLTYNIFMRPYFIKTNKSDFKDSRLKKISQIIKNYDIVCFQEIFDTLTHRHQKLINEAKDAGFKYFTDGQSPSFFSPFLIDSGLLIISKYPIIFSK